MQKYLLTVLLGAVVGLLGGLQGNAGSLYILTGLLLLGIVDNQRKAAGTTLLYTSVPLTLAAAYAYYRKGDVDLPIAGLLISTAIIFSFLGAKLNYLIPQKFVLYSIFVSTFLSSAYFLRKALKEN
tara:strand:- start:2114 stop:2491 length:378 start_codon:yes stop_codon:yes gene_type:complete